jgi:hypothetical protein
MVVSNNEEWIVTFLNEATDEQILHLFKQGIDVSVQEEIKQLLRFRKDNNPNQS